MGYRSEVKIAMKKGDYEELKARLDYYANKEEISYILQSGVCKVKKKSNGVVVLYWDWIKWYPEYEEIQFIENYLAELSEQGKPYKFVRVGEDPDDVEVSESWGEDEDDCCDIIRPQVYVEIEEDDE